MVNAQRASVLKGEYSSAAVLGLMKHMSFVVGMRLHFLIFAGIQKVPFVPLPYATKVAGLLGPGDAHASHHRSQCRQTLRVS